MHAQQNIKKKIPTIFFTQFLQALDFPHPYHVSST